MLPACMGTIGMMKKYFTMQMSITNMVHSSIWTTSSTRITKVFIRPYRMVSINPRPIWAVVRIIAIYNPLTIMSDQPPGHHFPKCWGRMTA